MAAHRWGRRIATAAGVAAGAGAAQLGLGYGLGVVAWLPAAAPGDVTWTASLVWATWIAATSTVVGAVCARRLEGQSIPDSSGPDQLVVLTTSKRLSGAGLKPGLLAVAAALGALVTVALVAVPARAATGAASSPQAVAAAYAAVGVALGLLVAFWALASRAVAANVVATACWVWLVAVVAVVDAVVSGQALAGTQLALFTSDSERFWFRDYFYWPGAAVALGSAMTIGAAAARRAARRPETRVGGAVSGLVGPLLIAAAYFLAAPRLAEIHAEQLSAHLMAPYLTMAGLAGSALVTAHAERAAARRADPKDAPTGAATPAPSAARPVVIPDQATGAPDDSAPDDGAGDGAGDDARSNEQAGAGAAPGAASQKRTWRFRGRRHR